MMETIAEKIVEQIPSLGVLCFVVIYFLRHLTAYNKVIETMNQQNLLAMEHLNTQNLDARKEQVKVIVENTRALTQNTEATRSFEIELKRYLTN